MSQRRPQHVLRFSRAGIGPAAWGPKPVLQSCAFVTIVESSGFPRHQHLNYQMIFVEAGRYLASLNGTELDLGPGDVLVVKPYDWHAERFEPPLAYFAVDFVFDDVPATPGRDKPGDGLFGSDITPPGQVTHLEPGRLRPLLEQLIREAGQPDLISLALQDNLLAQILLRTMRAFPPSALREGLMARGADELFLFRLDRLFHQNARRSMGVDEMAASLGMSERSLTAYCRRLLRESPARAFLRHRLETAATLLARTAMSVKEVSGHMGFENPYHFSRAYKRHFGRSPSQR